MIVGTRSPSSHASLNTTQHYTHLVDVEPAAMEASASDGVRG